jgi:hypothetical protein
MIKEMKEMKEISNWLVARLSKPVGHINPFGSYTPQTELNEIVKFDYMGAAEYEYGAIPKCLAKLWDSELVFESWNAPGEAVIEQVHIIYIKNDDIIDIINSIQDIYESGKDKIVREVSKGDYGSYYKALNNVSQDYGSIGWINIEHNFAWFIDKEIAVDFFNHLDNQGHIMLNKEMTDGDNI